MTEIIKCGQCGATFAACSDGYQDEEWNEAKNEYLAGGCTVEYIEPSELKMSACDHPKTPKQIRQQSQMRLFED